MRKKIMQQLLNERAERIDLLEQRLDTNERLIESYRAREHSIVAALTDAQTACERRLAEAEARAQQITADAESRAQARLAEAEERGAGLLRQTELKLAEYEQLIGQYNTFIEQSAQEAAKTAANYAAYVKRQRIDVSSLIRDAEALAAAEGKKPVDLPDAADDPALLMQNIYRIQNRDIPDIGRAAEPVHASGQAVPEPEPQPVSEPEPQPVPAPEPEPEVPTVTRYATAETDAEELSLDALLDEIIKAGEAQNG